MEKIKKDIFKDLCSEFAQVSLAFILYAWLNVK